MELGNGRAVMFHLSNIIKLRTSEHYQTLSNSEPGPATSMLSNNVRNRIQARALHVNKIQIDDL